MMVLGNSDLRKSPKRHIYNVPVVVTRPGSPELKKRDSQADISNEVFDVKHDDHNDYWENEPYYDPLDCLHSRLELTPEDIYQFNMRYGSPHHTRSHSVKTYKRNTNLLSPGYHDRPRMASVPYVAPEEELYRLREFSIAGKRIINRGDSFRRKRRSQSSNNSVNSSISSHSLEAVVQSEIADVSSAGFSGPPSPQVSSRGSSAGGSGSACETRSPAYRIVMIGAAGVGKTAITNQFLTSEFMNPHESSLDEDCGEKSVSILLEGTESDLEFIDHSHAEMSLENSITTYCPHALVIVYSVDDRGSFLYSEEVLQYLWKTDSVSHRAVVLVGNKTDLVRTRIISTEEGKRLATNYDSKFIETSSGLNHKIDQLLVGILTQVRLKCPNGDLETARELQRRRSSKKKYKSKKSATEKVRGFLKQIWTRDIKSKSCENLQAL